MFISFAAPHLGDVRTHSCTHAHAHTRTPRQETLERLEKLATQEGDHAFLLVQPISQTPTTLSPFKRLGPSIHDHYYISLLMHVPGQQESMSCSCLSQSVVRGAKGIELQRHLENGLGDVLWEFARRFRP